MKFSYFHLFQAFIKANHEYFNYKNYFISLNLNFLILQRAKELILFFFRDKKGFFQITFEKTYHFIQYNPN
jgi:hypothetical protein